MSENLKARHRTIEDLMAYFRMSLSDDEEGETEEHLAECADCARLGRQIREDSFAIDHWTAQSHADAHLKLVLARAVEEAGTRTSNAEWRHRLATWRREFGSKAAAAVQVILNTPQEAASGVARLADIVTVGMDAILTPGSMQLAPALRVRGNELQIWRRALPSVELVADPDELSTQVEVFGEDRKIEVRLGAQPAGKNLPLVILIPTEGGGEAQMRAVEQIPGGNAAFFVARFENLAPGRYLVAFEPRQPKEN